MNGVNHTEDQFLQKITEIIDANLHNEHFGVTELAEQLGMSRITLHRKVKAVIRKSVSELIREARLNRALELLRENGGTVSEIAYKVGFGSVTYFNTSFHEHFGFTPGEVLKGLHPQVEEVTIEPKPAKRKILTKRKLLFVVIPAAVVLLVAFFLFKVIASPSEEENTIAILPFVNDSGEEFAPFTTWMGIEIGNKLGKIENMLVLPQSTTESYRDSKKSNRDIAHQLKVDHILRGRTFITGDKILVNIELLEAKTGQSLFTEIFGQDIDESGEVDLNCLFKICEDVVFQITDKLQTDLTPVEKEQVTKKPTENMVALRAYQQAYHHLELARLNEISDNQLSINEHNKAKKLFEEAVNIDSTFADAYTMLGHIYINHLPFYADIYLADRYLDTGKIYLDKALHFDKSNSLTVGFIRQYYIQKGMVDEADKWLPLMEKKVKFYGYYMGKLSEYCDLNDRYHVAEAFLSYIETKPPEAPVRNYMSERAFWNYLYMGFPVRARELSEEKWKTTHDTFPYLIRKVSIEIHYGLKDSALKMCNQIHNKYPSYLGHLFYGIQCCNFCGEYAKALDTLKKLEEKILLVSDSIAPNYYVHGYTYLKNGMKEKADYHFKGSIKRAEDEIKLNSANARTYNSHFSLARIYSILNDKQKSLQYLEIIKKSPSVPFTFIKDLKNDPMFDNVRSEPEFQKIACELEKKYLEEHEKIKKLIIRKGLEPA
jgi:AraC-like DNA-binding protein/TolB-like protein